MRANQLSRCFGGHSRRHLSVYKFCLFISSLVSLLSLHTISANQTATHQNQEQQKSLSQNNNNNSTIITQHVNSTMATMSTNSTQTFASAAPASSSQPATGQLVSKSSPTVKGQSSRAQTTTVSSPSRQLKQQQQQQTPTQLSSAAAQQKQSRTQQSPGDNQMAADDAHETQAFMPTSGSTSATPTHDQLEREHEHELKMMMAAMQQADNRKQQQQQSSKAATWQTVSSTSLVQPATPTGSPAWTGRAKSGTSPPPTRYLPPPPPPVGYNSYAAAASRHLAADQQFQQQHDLDTNQIERPNAGYSYGGTSYTHTAIVQPSSSKVAHSRQRQFHEDGLQMAPRNSAPPVAQLPQFSPSGTQAYAQRPATSVGMMPVPQLSVTGTPANPCRNPSALMSGGGGGGGDDRLQQSNELLATSSSTSSNFNQKYTRAGVATRLRSQFVFKVLRADSLTECELACSRASQMAGGNALDTCRSFNYRAYFAAENCELSRHDLRHLNREDSTQFEPHTQFDFYALDSQKSSQLAQLQQQPIVQQQQQQQLSPDQLTDCLDVSQSCTQEGMEFTLRTSEPFNGRIYTYGFYDSCAYDGEGSTTSVLRISRSNGFPRCGTQQIGDLMTNIVVVQFNDFVQTTRDKKYNLTCYFSGPGEAVVTSNYLDTKIDERQHPMQIEHLPPQNVVTSNVHLRVLYRGQPTNTIAVGDLLTFRLETTSASGGGQAQPKQGRAHEAGAGSMNEIFATNVIAKDPYSGRQVQLIDGRGCPVDAINVFPELQRTPDGALESEFYAFKIPDSNFLIFQATVRTCKSPCEPVICHSTSASGSLTNLERPPTTSAVVSGGAHHSAGIKGGASSPGALGAYLMAPHQSSAPSWGRRRKRESASGVAEDDEDEQLAIGADAGESVEHVIPVRNSNKRATNMGAKQEDQLMDEQVQVMTRVKRPELSEAEEEVKEMFRVYLTRAEINKQLKRSPPASSLSDRQALTRGNLTLAGSEGDLAPVAPVINLSSDHDDEQVCLAAGGFYLLLFALISLTLIVLGVLFVAIYVTRKAKFRISDALADSIF